MALEGTTKAQDARKGGEAIYTASDTLKAAVLDILRERVGQENAIERWALAYSVGIRLGLSVGWGDRKSLEPVDRKVRAAIAALRLQGHLIANLSGTGYFVCATRAEAEAFAAQERSRTREVEAMLRVWEREADHLFPQMGLGL